jgi:yecA family protein
MTEMTRAEEDYEILENSLLVVGSELTPAHIHGTMMGLLCIGHDTPQNCWQTLEVEIPFIKNEYQSIHGLFRSLYSKTVADLHDLEQGVTLMLPSDEAPLPQRLEAVAQWCEGFMAGVKLASLPKEELFNKPMVKEVLMDLVQIQEVSFDEHETHENEKAYMEIVEFLRVGVLLVHAECLPVNEQRDKELLQTVH